MHHLLEQHSLPVLLLLLPVLLLHPSVLQLLSGSNAGCKLWSPTTGACLGSIDTGYALCAAYVPGNRHALVGTKVGGGVRGGGEE